jgi:4-hydroxybutyrate CoA-transferase
MVSDPAVREPVAARGGPRLVSARGAVAHVRSGQRVFVHGAAATPHALLAALANRAHELRDVEIVHLHTNGPAPHIDPDMAGHLRHRALFVGANVREAVNAGRADFVPIFLSDIPALFSSGRLPLDVALIHVAPPDAHGYCSLGTSIDTLHAAVASARLVIAQVNPRVPRTLGNSFIRWDQIDFAVEVDAPLLTHELDPASDMERRIGAYVSADLPYRAQTPRHRRSGSGPQRTIGQASHSRAVLRCGPTDAHKLDVAIAIA